MIALGLLGFLVVAVGLVLILMAFPLPLTFAATYRRIAWLPVATLLVEAILWKPVLTTLSYFAVIPPLLTCIASLVLAAVGMNLATGPGRAEGSSALLRSTLIAAIPGVLLLAVLLYGFVNTMLGRA
jgi:hypothetical protein